MNHAAHSAFDGETDPPGKGKRPFLERKLLDSWFTKNQYFEGETGLRVGTFVDAGWKKVFGITIGEYTELNYKAEYNNYQTATDVSTTRYLTFGASYFLGTEYKYNLSANKFDSFSIGGLGLSIEYSGIDKQLYFGIDTGFSLGVGIGGFANIKAGWRFDLK